MNTRGVLYWLVVVVVALIVGAAGYGTIHAAGPPATGARGGASRNGAGATTPGTAKGQDTTVDVGTGYAPLPGPPAIATPCTITGTVSGALAPGDLTMPKRLNRDATQATCAAPKPVPSTVSAVNYYDTYTYTNTSPDPQCVTASLAALTCNAQLSVYLDSFDPNDPTQNYLADPGLSTGAGGTVWTSFTVPAGHDFVVVVNDPNGMTGCAAYTLAVGGCPVPMTPTPTATATPLPCGSQLPEPWATAVPQPPVRYRAGGTSDGTYIYVFGGGYVMGTYLNDLWRWNPATETWTGLTNMPTGKQNIQGVYYGGKIYVPGGYNGVHLTENAIYDLATNTWFTGSPLPAPQTGATAAYNGKIYVFGGNPGPQTTTSIYDIASNTWFTGAAMPEPITYGRAVTVGGYAYYVGGIAGIATTNAVYRYDFAANTWATMAPLQTARASCRGHGLPRRHEDLRGHGRRLQLLHRRPAACVRGDL